MMRAVFVFRTAHTLTSINHLPSLPQAHKSSAGSSDLDRPFPPIRAGSVALRVVGHSIHPPLPPPHSPHPTPGLPQSFLTRTWTILL